MLGDADAGARHHEGCDGGDVECVAAIAAGSSIEFTLILPPEITLTESIRVRCKGKVVRVDEGTPQEMYVWPYFAHVPLQRLTSEQKVELFRIVTRSDYKKMKEFGAYIFYRVGIAPDGTWHFFVAGD